MSAMAFLFPGQGSQYAGMGKSLHDAFATAKQTFEEADDALQMNLAALCFSGSEEDLKKTENTQPALLAVSTAACRVLRDNGLEAQLLLGHSLGEYSALVAAQCLDFGDALRLVQMRGRFMQEAVPQGVGAMAAILKLPEGKLELIVAEAARGQILSAANLNSPDQTVISGNAEAVERAMALALESGAKRAIKLPVSAPFHCSLMEPAQEKLRPYLEATTFRDLTVPLVNNWQAAMVKSGDAAREGLVQQIPNPVRWVESVRRMKAEGVKRIVEVGPGSVLIGLCRNIDSSLAGAKFGEAAELEKLMTFASN